MIWNFVEKQLLGMKWLNELIGMLLEKAGLDITGRLGGSVHFFIYDVIKITILLCTLIFIISYIQSYFPPERSKKIMEYGVMSMPALVMNEKIVSMGKVLKAKEVEKLLQKEGF